MPTFENLLYEVHDQIAVVMVNRPAVLNALNVATLGELSEVFASIQSDPAVSIVILTGAGDKAFVAGADIGELKSMDVAGGQRYSEFGHAVLNQIENLGKPVIAAINGYALGGGCELAMACTLRLASETAKLGQPEVKLGVIAGFGGTQRLPRLVGRGVAMQLLLTGEAISAQEALRIGLVNEVVPPADLLTRAFAIAQQIISKPGSALRLTLEAVNHGLDMTQEEGMFLESSLFAITCGTEDKNEGTAAFLEKREPKFSGK